MPFYNVRLIATCDCVIEADSEDDAVEAALNETGSGDYQFIEGKFDGEIPADQLDRYIRHCDFKSLLS